MAVLSQLEFKNLKDTSLKLCDDPSKTSVSWVMLDELICAAELQGCYEAILCEPPVTGQLEWQIT